MRSVGVVKSRLYVRMKGGIGRFKKHTKMTGCAKDKYDELERENIQLKAIHKWHKKTFTRNGLTTKKSRLCSALRRGAGVQKQTGRDA